MDKAPLQFHQPCAHHDVITLQIEACQESIKALTQLYRDSTASHAATYEEISKTQGDLKSDMSGLTAKITLITVLATPVWAALAGVTIKIIAGL